MELIDKSPLSLGTVVVSLRKDVTVIYCGKYEINTTFKYKKQYIPRLRKGQYFH